MDDLRKRIEKIYKECDERAKDSMRRPGKRAVYGHIASELEKALKETENG